MKRTTLLNFFKSSLKSKSRLVAGVCFCLFIVAPSEVSAQEPYSLTVFDEILFYDGYAQPVDEPVPAGVIRHSNSLYAKKITDEQLAQFGNKLTLNVTIKASCDNYDRIGNVNLAFVPKNATSYNPSEVQRIEIGRYITPFMNKNRQPDRVPYTFDIDNVAQIFKDTQLTSEYDFWVELELFGVPYAANNEVQGCSGRNDVFFGTLEFVSENDASVTYSNNHLTALAFKDELRRYNAAGTDVVGQTVRTLTFTLDAPLANAKLYLITSNHGAGSGGEEYVRRWHYIYFDGPEVLRYRPGGLSCEQFRQYNTQGNGIYGTAPRDWAWNNWCPGDKIPIRIIELGALSAGEHSFKIDVPDARFVNNDGMIPMSVYLQSYDQVLSTDILSAGQVAVYPNPVKNTLTINSGNLDVNQVTVFSVTGQEVLKSTSATPDLSSLHSGVYIVKVLLSNNETAVKKIVKE